LGGAGLGAVDRSRLCDSRRRAGRAALGRWPPFARALRTHRARQRGAGPVAIARGAGALIEQLKPIWQRWLSRRIPPAPRVTLDHRRIFIMPTRTGATFALVLFLMLLVAINYQNSLAYGLTFLLMSLSVLGILHTYRNVSGLILSAG